mgnify:FL=1|jgi:hypothetical protein|tara:strand:- start:765 stop:1241 length:477 start_codon:yes stop_codon:yes gene_type:complete
MLLIGTTRFDNATWSENELYRIRKKVEGCIYGCPKRIAETIPVNSSVAIIEMNNSTNKIMGIGIIVNYLRMDTNYHIYSDGNYNRYVYKSKYRIDCSEFKTNEVPLIKYLEKITFYGKTHLKRGQGITLVPQKKTEPYSVEKLPIHEFIMEMFRRRYS